MALLALTAAPGIAQTTLETTLEAARAAMVRNPRDVLPLVRKARREVGQDRSRDARLVAARADWLEAEALGRLGQLDPADTISGRALATVQALAPDSKLHADILMTRGGIALDENRVRDAFEHFRRAHTIFARLKETRSQAIALQNIGTIYSFAGDQRSVLRYYAQAREVHAGDPALAQAASNNLGTAYRELRDFPRAEAEFRRAVSLARKLESPVLEARALNNLASVALLQGNLREADRLADRGLRLTRSGDAAEWAPFLWGVKGQVALARSDPERAVALFGRAFAGTDLTTTSFYFRDFHESAAKAHSAIGDLAGAYRHLTAFKRLDDEAREIRSSTNAALAAAQFDFSTQELRIARLREGQLARDVKIERARARQQLILFLATFVLLVVTTIAFIWVRRSRNATRLANRELAATNTALDKALQAKSEFLATTSHEIRTPLNGILGMTQVLLGRRTLDPAVADQVRLIDSAGNTMKAIVDDILDMSQIEQGQVQVARTQVDLPALVADIAGLWQSTAERKGLSFEVDVTAAPPVIEEDDRKLRQIGFNLLSNAVKFTRSGTVRLRVFAEGAEAGETLVLEVADTGIGIAADQQDAIFEPFRQADGSTSREFGGTGLGLAISSKLAAALDGAITVDSTPGVGSTFALRLPLRRVEVAAPATEAPPATTLEQARIGVVEPNPLFAAMVEACLSAAAAAVEVVDDAELLPIGCDIVVLGEDVQPIEAGAVRRRMPAVLLVTLGTPAPNVNPDLNVDRQMPPLHLPDALTELLAREPRSAARAA